MSELKQLLTRKERLENKLDGYLLEDKEVDQVNEELDQINRDIRNHKRKEILEKIEEHQAVIDQRKKNIKKYKEDREKFQVELNEYKPKFKEIEQQYLAARAKLKDLEEKASRPNMLRKIEQAEQTIKQRKEKINKLRGEK
jgi:chromosome segregation ATPase